MRYITAAIQRYSPRQQKIIALVGLATFFFGFGAGALLNLYLLTIHSPLVVSLRSSLTYKSAIFGDGIILPIVNMMAMAFLFRYKEFVSKKFIRISLICGLLITTYFHVSQAVNNLVNWAMPSPWHWNALGVWHALYMFAVASFLSLFYMVAFKATKKSKKAARDAALVTLGIMVFFILLRLDYVTVSFSNLIPHL